MFLVLYQVTVGNTSMEVGSLHFDDQKEIQDLTSALTSLPLPVIAVIVLIALVMVSVIVVVCVLYRRKARESDRVQKDMQKSLVTLEARVAKECKEAFAELQTDMTEITREISGNIGIPFLPYRDFCMNSLFPGTVAEEHPVIRGVRVGKIGQRQSEY